MSTRAILDLKGEDGGSLRLYCAHDGYVGGLGEYLYDFCKRQKVGMSPAEVLYALLIDNRYGLETYGENEILDYVYQINCSSTQMPLLLCWDVDYSGNYKDKSFNERLIPVDLEVKMNEIKNNIWPGLSPCPYCGKQPSIGWSSHKGNTVSCDDVSCKGSSLIGWYQVERDAEIAWNEQCKKSHPKG